MTETHIGLVAGVLTSSAAIPQLIKSYRSRHMRDISFWQLVLINAGLLLWLVYGIMLRDLPIIIANSFTLLCYTLLIAMKITWREGDSDCPDDYIARKTEVEEDS